MIWSRSKQCHMMFNLLDIGCTFWKNCVSECYRLSPITQLIKNLLENYTVYRTVKCWLHWCDGYLWNRISSPPPFHQFKYSNIGTSHLPIMFFMSERGRGLYHDLIKFSDDLWANMTQRDKLVKHCRHHLLKNMKGIALSEPSINANYRSLRQWVIDTKSTEGQYTLASQLLCWEKRWN